MDAAFMPSEVAVHHTVTHHFVLELGPSITRLGRPVRTACLVALALYLVGDIVQAVLKRERGRGRKSDEED